MLEYRLNNEPIVVGLDTSVKIKWVNPACFFDKIPSDSGLGIEIGVNEYTRSKFGNPERFEKYNAGNDREFPGFEIRFSGFLLHKGTLIITDANSETYTGWVRGEVGNIGDAEREKYIHENERFDVDQQFINKIEYSPENDNFCFPKISNPSFFEGIGSKVKSTRMVDDPDNPGEEIEEEYETTAMSYWFDKSTGGFINDKNAGNYLKTDEAIFIIYKINESDNAYINPIVPMFYLNYILTELLKSHEFAIDENFIEDHEQFSHLCIYNNYDITPIVPLSVSVDVIIDPYQSGDWEFVGGTRSFGSEFEGIQRLSADNNYFKPKNHLPRVKLADFLLGIQNYLNICLHFRRDGFVDILDRDALLTGSSYDLNNYFLKNWILGEKKNLTLKFSMEHDKDDLIFSERFVDLSERFEDILDPVDAWEDFGSISADPDDIRFVRSDNIYAEYGWYEKTLTDPETWEEVPINKLGWEVISIGFQPAFYNYGNADQEKIDTVFSTLYTTPWLALQEGAIDYKKFRFAEFSPRLIFDNYAPYQSQSLDWYHYKSSYFYTGDVGIVSKRYKYWAPFWANRLPVTGEFQLPLNILYYVIQNICKKFRTRHGEFIIEEMETEFKGNMIGETVIKGYKVE